MEDYTIDDSADTDDNWFDYADVFVEVLCGERPQQSPIVGRLGQPTMGACN